VPLSVEIKPINVYGRLLVMAELVSYAIAVDAGQSPSLPLSVPSACRNGICPLAKLKSRMTAVVG
jgi:hypothetical protein